MGETEFSGRLAEQAGGRAGGQAGSGGVGRLVSVRCWRLVGVLEGEKSRQLCVGNRRKEREEEG